MSDEPVWILLPSTYSVERRRLLWIEYQAQYRSEGSVGRRTFFSRMCATVEPHLDCFLDATTRSSLKDSLIPSIDDSAKSLDRYFASGLLSSRGDVIHRFVDAYLRIANPSRAARAAPNKCLQTIGEMMANFMETSWGKSGTKSSPCKYIKAYSYKIQGGSFLQSAEESRRSVQGIRPISRRFHERFFIVSAGTVEGYLLVTDFKADYSYLEERGHPDLGEVPSLDVYLGFCNNSRDLTSVHLKSMRHSGSIVMTSKKPLDQDYVLSAQKVPFRLSVTACEEFHDFVNIDLKIEGERVYRSDSIMLTEIKSPLICNVLADKVENIHWGVV